MIKTVMKRLCYSKKKSDKILELEVKAKKTVTIEQLLAQKKSIHH